MANRTVKDANSVKGTNPQYLVEKIIRSRIYECKYWKEECFALSAELLVDKAMALKYVGGVYGGNVQPTPFICLILKMLQIQPERDIIVEFIQNEDFKYVRVLGATYMRLVGNPVECYKYLEPLFNDYRKIKQMDRQGEISLIHVDEYIDLLLRDDRMCDIILPRLQKRQILEESNELEPRVSALDDDLENMDEEEEEEIIPIKEKRRTPSPDRRGGYRDLDKPDPRNTLPVYRRSKSPERRDRERRERRASRERERDKRVRSPVRRERKREEEDDSRPKRRRGHHDHGRDNARDNVRDNARDNVRDNPRDNVRENPRDNVRDSHRDNVRDNPRDNVRDNVRDNTRNHHKDSGSSRHKDTRERHSREALDIREANELRAKLGMPPLR